MKKTRFKGRKEFFGSLLYDTESHQFFPIDRFSTIILEFLSRLTISEIVSVMVKSEPEKNIKEQINYLKNLGAITPSDSLAVEWVSQNKEINGMLSAPMRLYFNVTNQCNFHCKHCVNSSGKKEEEELTLEVSSTHFFRQLFAINDLRNFV